MRIGELCSYAPKSTIKAGEAVDGAKYMFFTSSADESKRYTEYQYDGEGIIMGTGGNATLHYYSGKYAVSTDCVVLVPRGNIRCKYLYYFLKANISVLEAGFKGAGLKHTNKKYISDIDVNTVPDFCKQDEIIAILDKLNAVINSRKEELQLLEDLVSARFVEMFGDPIRNTHNRHTTEFSNVVKMQRGFDLPVQARQRCGDIPVYGSNGVLDYHNVAKIQGGGVITGRSGTIGKVFYTEGDYWPLNTSLFSVDTHGNNVIYLAYLLQMFDLSRFVEGTGVPTLNRNMFHDKQIIDVSRYEQEQFADFVKQVDKSKSMQQYI